MDFKHNRLLNQLGNFKVLVEQSGGNPYLSLKTISYRLNIELSTRLSGLERALALYKSRLNTTFVWPYDCCLCREPDVNGGICKACRSLIVGNIRSCRLCAYPSISLQAQVETICESCNIEPPLYDSAVVPYLYQFPADQMVLQLKYHDSPGVARAMAQLMTGPLRLQIDRTASAPDFLVPVPLLPARFRSRGFNQSMKLCRRLSGHLKIPVHATALNRSATSDDTAEQSQTGLDRENRLAASHMSFNAADVSGLRLLLVDDVMTTGATFDNAAAALLDAGARSVSVCAFARTPL